MLLFMLNNCLVQVPTALCSPECLVGYAKKQNGIHKCCFNCEICPNGTYINVTGKSVNTKYKKYKKWFPNSFLGESFFCLFVFCFWYLQN